MKIQSLMSQKIILLHKVKIRYFKQKCQASEKYLYFYALSWGWGFFCMNYCINAAWHGGDQPVLLLRCSGSPGYLDNGRQVIIVGSGLSSSSRQYTIDSL
ncbi:hypothetical protein AMECASPLE_034763 [Ameca splendens]|uniref:Uncharacterized protein n=1 Tax=Ameca splendens TaxID=208324 RepID=A0ABV0Y723_9TELE